MAEALLYDDATGLLRWRHRPASHFSGSAARAESWNARFSDKHALHYTNPLGYRTGKVGGKLILAHRAIWALVWGIWPELEIDHKDGDRSNNRIENLREATYAQQHQNQMKRPSKSGLKGVSVTGPRFTDRKRYQAMIQVHGKQIFLGLYPTAEAAHLAYVVAAKEHFGEFARIE